MTSFLFRFQFSQKKSQLSTSKFRKILRHVWYFVLIFPFLIRFPSCGDVSCFFYSSYVDILDLFGCCILVELLQSLLVGLYLIRVCFLFSFVSGLYQYQNLRFFLFFLNLCKVRHGLYPIRFCSCFLSWTYITVFIPSSIGFAKKIFQSLCHGLNLIRFCACYPSAVYNTVVVCYLWWQ